MRKCRRPLPAPLRMYAGAMSSSMCVGEENSCLWNVKNKDKMEVGTEKKKEISMGIMGLWPCNPHYHSFNIVSVNNDLLTNM